MFKDGLEDLNDEMKTMLLRSADGEGIKSVIGVKAIIAPIIICDDILE